MPKGLNDIHDLDLFQLVHSRAPSWYGDSLQAFLPRGFTTLPWPEPLPLLSIEPLLDPIQRRRPTMQDCWWRDGPTNTWCFIVFFCGFLPWRTYRQGIRRHLTKVPKRCCSSCSKKSRTVVLEVESIELCLTVLGNQKLSIHLTYTWSCDLTTQRKDTKNIASECSFTGALFNHLLDRCGCQSKIPQLHGR